MHLFDVAQFTVYIILSPANFSSIKIQRNIRQCTVTLDIVIHMFLYIQSMAV